MHELVKDYYGIFAGWGKSLPFGATPVGEEDCGCC